MKHSQKRARLRDPVKSPPKPQPFPFLCERFEEVGCYHPRKMFGCHVFYREDVLVAVFNDQRDDPDWNGFLIPTERDQHEAIKTEFPMLVSHPILPKWLYLPETYEDFEEISMQIVDHILQQDPRFGVIGKASPRKTKHTSKKKKKKKKKKTKKKK